MASLFPEVSQESGEQTTVRIVRSGVGMNLRWWAPGGVISIRGDIFPSGNSTEDMVVCGNLPGMAFSDVVVFMSIK